MKSGPADQQVASTKGAIRSIRRPGASVRVGAAMHDVQITLAIIL